MKIILAAKSSERGALFQAFLRGYDVECCVVDSLQEVITHASTEEHAGVLIDMPLLIRKHVSIMNELDDILNGLPSAILNIHAPSGAVHFLSRGGISSGCSSIDHFIKICLQFVPKTIIYRYRQAFHHNVILYRTPELHDGYRSACLDISLSGCYLFYTRDDLLEGEPVWITFPEHIHPSPLKGMVSWVRTWGTTENIPGIGVTFCEPLENVTA